MPLFNNIQNSINNNFIGCTINLHTDLTENLKTGYAVSLTNHKMTESDEIEIVRIYTLAISEKRENCYLGYWPDPNSNDRYLDISLHIQDINEAFEYARKYDQLAIYDFAKDETKFLDAQTA